MSEPAQITAATQVDLPGAATGVAKEKPDLWRGFQAPGEATGNAGAPERAVTAPRQPRAGHRSRQRGLLAITTLGWPQAIRGLSRIRYVSNKRAADKASDEPGPGPDPQFE